MSTQKKSSTPAKKVEGVVLERPKLTAWSYSRLMDYETCPYKFMQKHIMRNREPDSEAAARGTQIHSAAEQWMKGSGKAAIPDVLKGIAVQLKQAYKSKAQAEEQWQFRRDWEWAKEWYGKDVWVRIKVDVHYLTEAGKNVRVIDLKTGKINVEKHQDQLSLYALAGMIKYPRTKTAEAVLWYSDHNTEYGGVKDGRVWTRAQMPKMIKVWEDRTRPMFNDNTFAPRPGAHCRYCHYRKSNGGPCKY